MSEVPTVLIVDLLAERQAFGKLGVANIVEFLPGWEVLLWSPHTDERVDYGFGKVVTSPQECDLVIITGSQRNVSQWEPWMDEVAELIRTSESTIFGICFGHQIVCKALGGEVVRAEHRSDVICDIEFDGNIETVLFTHQDHVINSGEMVTVASADHCKIAACVHPERAILTVQFHPEARENVLQAALECGDLSKEEYANFSGIENLSSLLGKMIG